MPQTMIAQLPTMIAPQNDDGTFGQTMLIKRIKYSTDLSVGVAYAGIVAVTQRLGVIIRDRISARHPGVAVKFTVGVANE